MNTDEEYMNSTGEKLLEFLEESATCFQAVETTGYRLDKAGYTHLSEGSEWKLSPGGKYYVTRNQSSLIAFRLPEADYTGFMIGASHSDSPSFRVKPIAEMTSEGHYVRLLTEPYGGGIYMSWMDKPLSVAGRVTILEEGKMLSRPILVDEDLFLIPSVAIHMDRKVNTEKNFNAAVDMLPLFSGKEGEGSFMAIVAEAADTKPENIIGSDLFLYNRTPGMLWGQEDEFVSAPRLDDLQCSFALLEAFVAAGEADLFADSGDCAGLAEDDKKQPHPASIPVFAMFDNEEVGSLTRQGADSTFLEDTLRRILIGLGEGEEAFLRRAAHSFLVSADNAQAVHPNHPEYSDPKNRVYMNDGIVIKVNGNQKYTSDGCSSAFFAMLCKQTGVNCQYYSNRSDLAGGSTLGNLSNAHFSVRAVDIGLAQLAMHSNYETAGTGDTSDLIRVMENFYKTAIREDADGSFTIIS